MSRRVGPEEVEENCGPLYGALQKLSENLGFIDKSATKPDTYRAAVAELLNSRPNEWIGGIELAHIGGFYAWRSRVSDCRTQLGMRIENRVRTLENGVKVSEYRVVT